MTFGEIHTYYFSQFLDTLPTVVSSSGLKKTASRPPFVNLYYTFLYQNSFFHIKMLLELRVMYYKDILTNKPQKRYTKKC